MSILFNGAYANPKQQLWASYASSSGTAGTASNITYCNASAYAADIETVISVNLPTQPPYPYPGNYNSPIVNLLNIQRQVAENLAFPNVTTTVNGNITFGDDDNLTNNRIDSFNIYSQDVNGIDQPVQIQGVPVYIQTTSRNDDSYSGDNSFFLSAYGPTLSIGGAPATGLIINNSENNFDGTAGTGVGTLYTGDDGNLHWYNQNTATDNQITPTGTASSIYNYNTTSTEAIIINATNVTDGGFPPSINLIQATLQDTSTTDTTLFQVKYIGEVGGAPSVTFTNQDLVSGAFYSFIFESSGDPTGALIINNDVYQRACALYPDSVGNLHGVINGTADESITGMNPFSFNGSTNNTLNQASCPSVIGGIAPVSLAPPTNINLTNNAIVNISINGTVTSPTLTQDMVTLGYNLTLYFSNDVSTTYTMTTTTSAYVSGVLMEPYPISLSFTELIPTGYVSGYGYVFNIVLDVIFLQGFIVNGDYTFNFNSMNLTITPQ